MRDVLDHSDDRDPIDAAAKPPTEWWRAAEVQSHELFGNDGHALAAFGVLWADEPAGDQLRANGAEVCSVDEDLGPTRETPTCAARVEHARCANVAAPAGVRRSTGIRYRLHTGFSPNARQEVVEKQLCGGELVPLLTQIYVHGE